jgi:hypothetical protein
MREAIRRVRELVRRKGPAFSSSPSILDLQRAATAIGGGGAGEEEGGTWIEGSIWALILSFGSSYRWAGPLLGLVNHVDSNFFSFIFLVEHAWNPPSKKIYQSCITMKEKKSVPRK